VKFHYHFFFFGLEVPESKHVMSRGNAMMQYPSIWSRFRLPLINSLTNIAQYFQVTILKHYVNNGLVIQNTIGIMFTCTCNVSLFVLRTLMFSTICFGLSFLNGSRSVTFHHPQQPYTKGHFLQPTDKTEKNTVQVHATRILN